MKGLWEAKCKRIFINGRKRNFKTADKDATQRGYGGELPPSIENLSFCKAKTAVQCISTGQLTEPRNI